MELAGSFSFLPLTTYISSHWQEDTQIFSFCSLLAPGAVAKDWGAVQFLCLGREKTKTFSYWDCRLSALHSGPRVDNCWTLPPWTENKILKSQLFTFCVWLSLSLSSFSREFSPPPPLCLPSSLKSCEETQVKSGKMCSHLTHFTLITNNTIPLKSPGCCANKANPRSIIICRECLIWSSLSINVTPYPSHIITEPIPLLVLAFFFIPCFIYDTL